MRKSGILISIVACVINAGVLFSQPMQYDYLGAIEFALQHSTEDTFKADMLNCLSRWHWGVGNMQLALENANKALAFSQQIGYSKGITYAYDNLGETLYYMGQKEEALMHFRSALHAAALSGDLASKAYSYRQLGWTYQSVGQYDSALVHFDASLFLRVQLKDTAGVREILSRKAMIFTALNDLSKARMFDDSATALMTPGQTVERGGSDGAFLSDLYSKVNLSHALAKQERQKKQLAYALGLIVLLTAVGAILLLRRQKQLGHQRALLNERLRISRELHDEVGATLTGIAMYSHLTKEQMLSDDRTAAQESLAIIQKSSGEMVNKLNDIVWLINPEQDSLEKLLGRLEEYAIQMASIKSMKVKAQLPATLAELRIPFENRRNIYLFCKEAINNAVKYSDGTELEIVVRQTQNDIEFSVKDNGKGFDEILVRRGNGLENMKTRADEIGAKLVLASRLNEGVSVSLFCKLPH